MTRTCARALRDDGGQTVVLLAISMPLFLALLLLVIDGGRLYVERERLLAAARLSAQAGVAAFDELGQGNRPLTDVEVRSVASDAVARNLPGEAVRSTIVVDRPKRRVDVRVEKRLEAIFGRIGVPIAAGFVAAGAPTPTRAPASAAPTPAPLPRPTSAIAPAISPTTIVPTPTPWAPIVLAMRDLANAPNDITVRGGSVYAALAGPGSGTGPGQLVTLDSALRGAPSSLQVGAYPRGVAVDPVRKRAYLAHVYPPKLTIVDTVTLKVITEVPLTGYRGQKVELDRDAGKVYVTGFCDSVAACSDYAVLVFDAASGARLSTVKLDRRPDEILVDGARKRAYAHEIFDGSISLIDTAANTVLRRVQLPDRAGAVALDETRDRLYALDGSGRFVTVIEGTSGRTVGTIQLGMLGPATGLAIDASTGRLYASAITARRYDPSTRTHSEASTIVAADIATGRTLGTYQVSGAAGKLAFDPLAGRLYLTQGRRVSVLTG
ncbi:MAG: YncE family protein [Chloroflexi bacterium]|nr:YncE family protein [Chloroflexota bacterium]